MKQRRSWLAVLMLAGSYTSYNIGSAFASGNEALQFFGSFGGYWPYIMIGVCILITAVTAYMMYAASYTKGFTKANQGYYYFCGKYIGFVYDWFISLTLICFILAMLAGSGATVHQLYDNVPVWVGTLVVGVLSAIAACFDLRKVIDALGFLGVVIIVSIVCVGVYALLTVGQSPIEASKNMLQYVQEGKILQAGVFGIHHPILGGVYYAGTLLICSIPWVITSGSALRSRKEVMTTSILSALFFWGCAACAVTTLLLNTDAVAGKQVPMLAAVQNMLPVLAIPYAVIIVMSIFTSITGMLWVLGDRFSKQGTKKFYAIVLGTTAFGVIGGSVLPFAQIVNVVYSFFGLTGLILGVFVIIKSIQIKRSGHNLVEDPTQTQEEPVIETATPCAE